MKQRSLQKGLVAAAVLLMVLTGASWPPSPAVAALDEWPRRFKDSQMEVHVYQPQLEELKDDRVWARAAISARKKEWKQPVFGAIWVNARVSVDRDSRTATIYEIKVSDTKLPSTSADQGVKVKDFINAQVDGNVEVIALDRLVAAMDLLEKERAMEEKLRNDPPLIVYRSQPAVLVLLDGEPRLLPVPDSTLMRVVNTPFMMLYLPADQSYYLKAGTVWASAAALAGPWKSVEALPEPIRELREKAGREASKRPSGSGETPGKEIELMEGGGLPEIVVSTEPAELIVTEGEPQYTPIENTGLLYVSNSQNTLFLDTAGGVFYVLLSGRWFKGGSLENGPWSFVPSTALPLDFAKIPEGSVKGFVLVNVAGTEQARDAVMDISIPQTAAIDRNKATIDIQYDGEPKFIKIPDVAVEYAVNTQDAVFKVGGTYYACVEAVWYESNSPRGPWKVSVAVAEEIYRIPPSNPHYNAKYVKVYDSTKDVAYVGYTPGYTGSYVSGGSVVYGTGYRYEPYYSPTAYVPYPATYGYSAVYNPYQAVWGYQPVYYNPYAWLAPAVVGVGVGLVVAAIVDDWWDYPSYYPWGWWGRGGYYYHNVRHHHYYHHRHARWRPRPEPYWRPGDRPTWRPGERPWRPGEGPGVGPGRRPGRPGERPGPGLGGRPGRRDQLLAGRANLYNRPGMENRLANVGGIQRPAQGDRPGARAGALLPGARRVEGARPRTADRAALDRSTARSSARRGRPTREPRTASEQMRRNNLFTDREGNVYRRDNRGSWQQRDGSRWAPVDRAARDQMGRQRRPADPSSRQGTVRPDRRPPVDTGSLHREFRARERGAERTNQFNRSRSFEPRSSFGRPPARGRSSFQGGGFRSPVDRGGSSFRGGGGSSFRGGGSSFRGTGGSEPRGGGGSSFRGGGGRGGGGGGGIGRR